MKLRNLISAVTILCFSSAAAFGAGLSYTFDSGAQGFQNGAWSSTRQAFQATSAAGGWTMGSGGGPMKEFNLGTEQTDMQALANTGLGRISFSLFVDGSSWTPGLPGWYQLHFAGNSDGALGWTQDPPAGGNPVNTNHAADDNATYAYNFDFSFAQMGWQPGDSWFQIFFGANSDGANPVKFYIDNVNVYSVPEPSVIALAGLGGAALLFLRRRIRV